MSASSQFLTVPPLSYRSSQHTRSDRERFAITQPPSTRHPTTRHVASSSRVKLEDTPLGTPVPTPPSTAGSAPHPPTSPGHPAPSHRASPPQQQQTTTTTTTLRPVHRKPTPLMAPSLPPAAPSSPPAGSSAQQQQQQQPQSPPLSPRSILRMVPLLLRLRPPNHDLFHLSCNSDGPHTDAALAGSLFQRFPHTLTYTRTFVCADGVNAEVLLRFARIDLFERAQRADRHVTALVDEEYGLPLFFISRPVRKLTKYNWSRSRWRYDIRQGKNGDYNIQARSAVS